MVVRLIILKIHTANFVHAWREEVTFYNGRWDTKSNQKLSQLLNNDYLHLGDSVIYLATYTPVTNYSTCIDFSNIYRGIDCVIEELRAECWLCDFAFM